jgi:hypothetical protein
LPALLAALRALGDAPARSLTALAQRLGVAEADAVVPLEEEPAPVVAVPAAVPASPLVPMTGPEFENRTHIQVHGNQLCETGHWAS